MGASPSLINLQNQLKDLENELNNILKDSENIDQLAPFSESLQKIISDLDLRLNQIEKKQENTSTKLIELTNFDQDLKNKISELATELTGIFVPIWRRINGHTLGSDISINKEDVGLSELDNIKQLTRSANDWADFDLKLEVNLSDILLLENSQNGLFKAKTTIGSVLARIDKVLIGLDQVTNDAQLKRTSNDFSNFMHASSNQNDRLLVEQANIGYEKGYITIGELPTNLENLHVDTINPVNLPIAINDNGTNLVNKIQGQLNNKQNRYTGIVGNFVMGGLDGTLIDSGKKLDDEATDNNSLFSAARVLKLINQETDIALVGIKYSTVAEAMQEGKRWIVITQNTAETQICFCNVSTLLMILPGIEWIIGEYYIECSNPTLIVNIQGPGTIKWSPSTGSCLIQGLGQSRLLLQNIAIDLGNAHGSNSTLFKMFEQVIISGFLQMDLPNLTGHGIHNDSAIPVICDTLIFMCNTQINPMCSLVLSGNIDTSRLIFIGKYSISDLIFKISGIVKSFTWLGETDCNIGISGNISSITSSFNKAINVIIGSDETILTHARLGLGVVDLQNHSNIALTDVWCSNVINGTAILNAVKELGDNFPKIRQIELEIHNPNEIYISPIGNDQNSGSFTSPYYSIQNAIAPNTMIHLASGVYSSPLQITHPDVTIQGENKAILNEPIQILSSNIVLTNVEVHNLILINAVGMVTLKSTYVTDIQVYTENELVLTIKNTEFGGILDLLDLPGTANGSCYLIGGAINPIVKVGTGWNFYLNSDTINPQITGPVQSLTQAPTSTLSRLIHQINHQLVIGEPVILVGNNYIPAAASANLYSTDGIVGSVTDPDNFLLIVGGITGSIFSNLTPGNTYYLDENPGNLTINPPVPPLITVPVILAISATEGLLLRGTAPSSQAAPTFWGSVTGNLASQTDLQTALDQKENLNQKGVDGGYAPLDMNGLIPRNNLPAIEWGDISGEIQNQTDLQLVFGTKENRLNRGLANGYAPLDSNAVVPTINLPSPQWGNLTGLIETQTDLQTILDAKQGISEKGLQGGYAPLDLNAKVPIINLPNTPWGSIVGLLNDQVDLITIFNEKENKSNRGAPNGYAPLDSSSHIPNSFLPSMQWGQLQGLVENQVDLSLILSTKEDKSSKAVSNGYAPLDSNAKVPVNNLPATQWGSIIGTLTSQADLINLLAEKEDRSNKAVAGGYVPLNQNTKIPEEFIIPPTWGSITGLINNQSDLILKLGQKENISEKGVPFGYVPLDGTGKIPITFLEDTQWGSIIGTISDQTDLDIELNARELKINKGQPGGYAPLDLNGLVPFSYVANTQWGTITGLLTNQTDLQNILDAKENIADKGAVNGYAPLDSNSLLPLNNLPLIPWGHLSGLITAQSDLQSALNLKENASNKGILGGYPSLDSNGLVPYNQLPLPVWGTLTGSLLDQLDLTSALNLKENTNNKGIPNGYAPLDSNGRIPSINSHLTMWGEISGSIATQADLQAILTQLETEIQQREIITNKGAVNGYAPLDSNAKVPVNYVPSTTWGSITGNITTQTDLLTILNTKEDKNNRGIAGGYAPLDSNAKVPTINVPSTTWGSITGTVSNQIDLQGIFDQIESEIQLRELLSHKATANGYAPLDSNAKIPIIHLPSTTWGSITGSLASQTDLQTALNAKEATANKGQAFGYAPLDSNSKVPLTNSYGSVWGTITGTLSNQTDLQTVLVSKEAITNKGIANGYTPLDANSKIPTTYIPNTQWGTITGSISTQNDLVAAFALKENLSNKGIASGYAPLDSNSKVPLANSYGSVWGTITGTLSNQTDLQSAFSAKESVVNKGVASGYAPLDTNSKIPTIYVPATQWGTITGTLSTQTDLQATFDLKENKTAKGIANGYAPLDTNSKVPTTNLPATQWGSITGTLANQTDLQSALALKEALANKGVALGYAPLDSLSKVPSANLPSTQWGTITGTLASQTDLQTALNAKESTANKAQPSGYAPLDSSSKVPTANLPSTQWGTITGTLTNQTDLTTALALKENSANKGIASGYAPLDSNSKVPITNTYATSWGSITGTLSAQTDLAAALTAKESTSNKGQASGYAPLDASSKVPSVNLPSTQWGTITGTLSAQTDLINALNAKESTSNKGTASGYAPLDSTSKLPAIYLPTIVPPGVLNPYTGTTAPSGYLMCDGASYLRTTYPELFVVIGTAYGTVDSTHFNVPDLRGLFLRGFDSGAARDPDRATRTALLAGGATGNNLGSYQTDSFKSHTHTVSSVVSSTPGANNGIFSGFSTGTVTSSASGGNETRPANVYVNYIIKT